MKCYPEEKDEEQMRRSLGRYGLTGKQQVLVRRGIHSEEFLYDGTSYCVYQAHLLHINCIVLQIYIFTNYILHNYYRHTCTDVFRYLGSLSFLWCLFQEMPTFF